VGVANGTAAVHLAVAACGIGEGDEVITTAHTYVGTGFAIAYAGAQPVFVDICPDTYNMNPALIERAITPQTKAILPVHMHGQPVDMEPLLEIAQRHGLRVIEDASQSHGASYKGRKVGSIGHIAAFDCYPHKNLGAYGDAACITTNDAELYERARLLRNMGLGDDGLHGLIGFHQRLDELQAAILCVKLRHLDQWNGQRQQLAALYDTLLEGLPLVTPAVTECGTHVYHSYVVRVAQRQALMEHLAAQGIESRVSYAVPVPLEPVFHSLGYGETDLPVAARFSREFLSLPMFPELTGDEVRQVAATIRDYFGSQPRAMAPAKVPAPGACDGEDVQTQRMAQEEAAEGD
jgi:dTDP-4-amino-4,6-dideoxygalactose transaminase